MVKYPFATLDTPISKRIKTRIKVNINSNSMFDTIQAECNIEVKRKIRCLSVA